MIKVNFTRKGIVVSDFEVIERAKSVIEQYLKEDNSDVVINTSTELYVHAFALCAMEGLIDSKELQFFVEEELITLDECAGLILPDNFKFDFPFITITETIIRVGYDNLKKSRENNKE